MIVGIDEVGRGAWAGPMVLAGVCFPRGLNGGIEKIETKLGWEWKVGRVCVRDSKKLSARQRLFARDWILENAETVVVEVAVEEIERLKLSDAWKLGVTKVMENWDRDVDCVIDGTMAVGNARSVVKGDAHVLEIACASIIAKVYRDSLMQSLSMDFGGYGWERNVGYGTREHQEGILEIGTCEHHREEWVKNWRNRRVS